ncbi:hypothetical protein C2845_PM04G22490 [Panicum miliaceum]|uniref:Acyltransferase-like protein n=1 Tax=Panicum miliaceum TaxID=4540 RepID=A0A3L6QKK1_PANMI|nr:hypothetical protein C2845_PM04G22490 [Panicum miliaceum]
MPPPGGSLPAPLLPRGVEPARILAARLEAEARAGGLAGGAARRARAGCEAAARAERNGMGARRCGQSSSRRCASGVERHTWRRRSRGARRSSSRAAPVWCERAGRSSAAGREPPLPVASPALADGGAPGDIYGGAAGSLLATSFPATGHAGGAQRRGGDGRTASLPAAAPRTRAVPSRVRRARVGAEEAARGGGGVELGLGVTAAGRGGGVEAAGEMARRKDGGPPRWFSPLECAGGERVPGAPTLLYLPGIDGVGLGLIRHHEKLAKMFELWCLHIPVEDRTSFEGNFMKMPSTIVGRGFSPVLASLTFLVDILTKESIMWKLKILKTAASFVNSRLHAVKAQTLVLASGNDELLPSSQEAEKLRGAIEKCRTRLFRDNGHKILLEAEFDLATTIKGAGYYRRSRKTDFVSDYLPPTPDELQQAINRDRILNFITDPVLLSTLPDGKIVRGLAGLPREGPAVLVGYHMLLGLELGPMVTGVLSSTGVHIRGLAHPFMFDKNSEQIMPDSAHFDLHRIMGAGEEYKLLWPDQPEFVRMASRFAATIIPFGVVGEDDICDLLLDYNDLQKLPFYDMLDKVLTRDGLKLRTDSMGELQDQGMHPVVVAPKVPGRFYIVFGKPIETRGREKERRDRDEAQRLYLQVKSEVESCINYLKEKREKDPYRSILHRLLYQAVFGPNTEIPTF